MKNSRRPSWPWPLYKDCPPGKKGGAGSMYSLRLGHAIRPPSGNSSEAEMLAKSNEDAARPPQNFQLIVYRRRESLLEKLSLRDLLVGGHCRSVKLQAPQVK